MFEERKIFRLLKNVVTLMSEIFVQLKIFWGKIDNFNLKKISKGFSRFQDFVSNVF